MTFWVIWMNGKLVRRIEQVLLMHRIWCCCQRRHVKD